MTGSGGFTPGTPVSTHIKKIWYKKRTKKKIILFYFKTSFNIEIAK